MKVTVEIHVAIASSKQSIAAELAIVIVSQVAYFIEFTGIHQIHPKTAW